MRRITNIETIREFTNGRYGEYKADFNGKNKTFIRHGDQIYVLQCYLNNPKLDIVQDDVKGEFMEELKRCKKVLGNIKDKITAMIDTENQPHQFSGEEVEQAYMKKHEENYRRQREGY